jgi:hypothetical protein
MMGKDFLQKSCFTAWSAQPEKPAKHSKLVPNFVSLPNIVLLRNEKRWGVRPFAKMKRGEKGIIDAAICICAR